MMSLRRELKDSKIWKELFSELLGTFLLVFLGISCGFDWPGSPSTGLQIALTNGLTVASLMQTLGNVSGCQINPAVTLSLLLFKQMKVTRAVLFIPAQLLGSVFAAALLQSISPESVQGALGATLPSHNLKVGQAFGIEFVGTLILVLTIFAVSDKGREDIEGSIPLAVGLTVAACNLATNKLTGGSMNPARSFGPALVTQNWREHWIYWMAPITGGMTGGMIYHKAFRVEKAVSVLPASGDYAEAYLTIQTIHP